MVALHMQSDRERGVGIDFKELRRLASLGGFSAEVLDQPNLLQILYNIEHRLIGQPGKPSDLYSGHGFIQPYCFQNDALVQQVGSLQVRAASDPGAVRMRFHRISVWPEKMFEAKLFKAIFCFFRARTWVSGQLFIDSGGRTPGTARFQNLGCVKAGAKEP
jgi:hypothetical protein